MIAREGYSLSLEACVFQESCLFLQSGFCMLRVESALSLRTLEDGPCFKGGF